MTEEIYEDVTENLTIEKIRRVMKEVEEIRDVFSRIDLEIFISFLLEKIEEQQKQIDKMSIKIVADAFLHDDQKVVIFNKKIESLEQENKKLKQVVEASKQLEDFAWSYGESLECDHENGDLYNEVIAKHVAWQQAIKELESKD